MCIYACTPFCVYSLIFLLAVHKTIRTCAMTAMSHVVTYVAQITLQTNLRSAFYVPLISALLYSTDM